MQPIKLDEQALARYERARSRGNFCEAYEGQLSASHAITHGHAAIPIELAGPLGPDVPEETVAAVRATWCAGFVLGFYGSYERHEVPANGQVDLFDAALCFAARHGFDTGRDESEADELKWGEADGMSYQFAIGLLCQELEVHDDEDV